MPSDIAIADLLTADFDFDLPADRIAQAPARPRDAARLLAIGSTLADHGVRDLPRLLRPCDLLVSNDTRVIPARLTGQRGAAAVEVTLHLQQAPDRWRVFARPAKRLRPGDEVVFAADLSAEVIDKGDGGEVGLHFNVGGADLLAALERHGRMPLPPYIRGGAEGEGDRADYQTLFARREGAVAAPTAGLHFTPDLLEALDAAGIARTVVTLHVGAGTFLPVKADRARDHRMHAEWGEVGQETVDAIAACRARGGRVVAVGTTSLRLLETAAAGGGLVRPFSGTTDIFILPGHRFQVVDLLMTNFHLPRSTLFMLVSALAGLERMKTAYTHAIGSGYRFYSYGDACLIERAA
ncbi:S-adenosylmethionine:tRNA ribosyltransferase-isomerase [Stella humosa]|uniref:S-adenosylmethionine:tRNA ribosyltransferase-isomerase n=1 Tax=Stella humosa TaxID=94 RepID=A0A3N1MCF2_9PROT|nr:tRNA preQ1(34) S-adenosylmethionine ribosyltransferase-isomerase QueA [Stella humosa]ROQ01393.1 S-adenosylmethionine:tRNA ribosyltransferase-isomerase [Stella humosa]BBK31768.1 S-adenosylmethionine:tRNA ribosyltransferase-isomerase [Stella humosa]